ncbi:MAG: manganese efflux pump MntP family protein [Firmicutes bacterium]|nr:manganese efflux pump MntP family protein [Bacillota bacterium]
MSLFELFLLAIALSIDAFAVSVCAGLGMPRVTLKKALIPGLYFGSLQAIMPLVGYLVARQFAAKIIAYDHWVAFGLLTFLGGKMVWDSFKKESYQDKEASLSPKQMLPLAVATSIDALAVGVSFAFLQVNILPAVCFIGLTTFSLSVLGVNIGHAFGVKFKAKAELVGGLILALIGLKILLEHLGMI